MWKNMIFISGKCKRGLQVCIGKWKNPFEQVAWGEVNLAITMIYVKMMKMHVSIVDLQVTLGKIEVVHEKILDVLVLLIIATNNP
jgi:hypothetical protein